jgi:cobalt-zinc-cadmium efflux system outer membrane protein
MRGRSEGASPDVAFAEALREGAAARVEVERAKRLPDPSVSAGFRRFHATDDSAFVVGISVPLPFWNSNSGAIAAARADQRRAEFEVAARERELVREIGFLSSQAEAARTEVTAYAERIIPSSKSALNQSLRAYRQGGLSYIEVLEAQSALTEVREKQINALLTYHRAEASLARRHGVLSSGNFQETSQ